jgi:hypothetical protein
MRDLESWVWDLEWEISKNGDDVELWIFKFDLGIWI